MAKNFLKKHVIDKYFLEEACPYTKRRPIKMKTFYWVSGSTLGLFVIGTLFIGGESEKKSSSAILEYSTQNQATVSTTNDSLALSPTSPTNAQAKNGNSFGFPAASIGYAGGGMAGNMSGRTRSANQVIRRGEGGNDPGSRLPMGHGISVRLLNAVLSTDSASPVIAEVTEDVFTHGSVSIPATTRAMGTATYDDASRRIQLRFHTFIYPDGDQHSVQAIGMMMDGSAGLAGDYNSGTAKRQFGRFLGNFVSGLAQGMKDRQAAGQSGIPYEPGSIKNGLLNGVTLSAEDQAKSYSEDLSQTKATMRLSAGQSFILFLEKEYLP